MSHIIMEFKMGWDKLWHFVGCMLLSIVLCVVTSNFVSNYKIIVLLVILLGLGKEIKDKYDPNHRCELWDFVADVLGAMLGGSIYINFIV